VIRQTDGDDWQLLREVRLRALADSPDAFLETVEQTSAFPESVWRTRAAQSETQACFLCEDGTGMVSCFVADDPTTLFLVAMWVAVERRGSGVARDLVERVVDWAREHGAARVSLSVEPGNDRAARLYEKCGFTETDDPPPFPYEPRPDNGFYVLEL
jgi:ribosomal protein S18 acetylase RimI-like enzyme